MTEPSALAGTAAGVPFVALPPAGGARPARVVVLWHLLGTPGTPAAMAAALPLRDVPAWRVYLELPGTGSRAPAAAWPEFLLETDLLLDAYGPIVEGAAGELPAVLTKLRTELPLGEGPIALVGGSAGGHAALLTLLRADLEVSAAVLVNPAVRAETVITVNERLADFRYPWTDAPRTAAARLDMLTAPAGNPGAAVLLVTGSEEYPEFQPDQSDLCDVLARRSPAPERVDHHVLPGVAHMFAEQPGDPPDAAAIDAEATAWLRRYFAPGDGTKDS